MALLVIESLTVPIDWPDGGEEQEPVEIGDRDRAFDGTLLTSIRGYKRRWAFRSAPIDSTAADALMAILEATPPLACSGDALGGSIDCVARYSGREIMTVGSGVRLFRVRFELEED